MSKKAMKLALEAYCKTLHPLWNAGISRTEAEGFFNAGFKAAEALAKQEQGEPVAWWVPKAEQFCLQDPSGERPFAKAWEPLYTTPQQRTWVGLSDEDYQVLREGVVKQGKPLHWMIEHIEAKLKEKNG